MEQESDGMKHEGLIHDAQEAVEARDYARAQALASIAIAERLDRLCEILSKGRHF